MKNLSEAYLETSQRSMMEPFCVNSQWLLTVKYFRGNPPSKTFGWLSRFSMLISYAMRSSNRIFASSCFPRFSVFRFFRIKVFQDPGFSGSMFFWVQVFRSPGFSWSGSRVWVLVLEVASNVSLSFIMVNSW